MANLHQSCLTEANLSQTNLTKANLSEVTGFAEAFLVQTIWTGALLPQQDRNLQNWKFPSWKQWQFAREERSFTYLHKLIK